MATKTFCDCCGKDLENKRPYRFSYRVHIADLFIGRASGRIHYTDADMNPTSDREEELDLCVVCYNKILPAAYKTFLDLKGKTEWGQPA